MVIAAAAALVVAAVVTSAGAREEVREIRLVARGMSFYLDTDPATANPTLTLRAGERVRMVLRNETPGIDHDLAIAAFGVGLSPLSAGTASSFDLDVPDRPGRHEYVCRPHAIMMKGVVEVQ
jgi:plastocyanin